VYNPSFQVHGWSRFMGGDGEETKEFPGDVLKINRRLKWDVLLQQTPLTT
jgi:hypothetical protein